MNSRGFGYISDPYDGKDWTLTGLGLTGSLSKAPISLETFAFPPIDQGGSNACTGFGVSDTYDTTCRSLGHRIKRSSPMACYAWSRHQHSHPDFPLTDDGSWLRSTIDGLRRHGVCAEEDYPWNPWAMDGFWREGQRIEILRVNSRPPFAAVRSGFDRRGPGRYYRIRGFGQSMLDQLDLALNHGIAVCIGTAVDETFINGIPNDPYIPYPSEFKFEGFHAVSLIGRLWKDGKRFYLMQNSYGPDYREGGRAWIDERYVIEARDRWAVLP